MIFLKIQDLEKKNVFIAGKSEFIFQDKLFKMKTTISKKHLDKIDAIVESYQNNELEIILVEHNIYFSLWLETKSLKDSKEHMHDFVNQKLKNLGL